MRNRKSPRLVIQGTPTLGLHHKEPSKLWDQVFYSRFSYRAKCWLPTSASRCLLFQ